jgi:hypothetical protein
MDKTFFVNPIAFSMHFPDDVDLRDIDWTPTPGDLKAAEVTYNCPCCGKQHQDRELYREYKSWDHVGLRPPCGLGFISIPMPWAKRNKQ